ncbi:YceI family protein [Beijerinckia indica]|uniref:YceI family protein n=1 Tax=Beijerinckia indica subsp. indica (strain ATCC 9039 / DSM 1715 / NCIMB 8712) TaxID=395963 RepID=B2IEF9_BEII9|nr:YceI family protein [Beijerinckia indica]ACB95557.1 YceI family protein [Beijerinckia indica subsp. indica ATCC 9039]
MKSSFLFALSFKSAFLAYGLALSPAAAQMITTPSEVKGGTYVVEPGHTQVGFSVLHLGFTNYSGVFSDVSGTLELDPKKPSASKLNVTIPIASVQTTSAKLTDELKSAQWFDAAQFANATFTSTKVELTGKNTATVTGTLTLHGVTKPTVLAVHFIAAGINPLDKKYTVGFEATGTIKRSDYDVKTYLPLIGDQVQLKIAGAFEHQD